MIHRTRPAVGMQGVSGECAGDHDPPDTPCKSVEVATAFVEVVLERQHEVHSLACRGPVITPVSGEAGDQHQASSGLRVSWLIHRHWHRARRVVHIDAEPAAGAGDDELDGPAYLVSDGVGHQFAGQQYRRGWVDGNVPGIDSRPYLAAGGACRRWSGDERDAPLA